MTKLPNRRFDLEWAIRDIRTRHGFASQAVPLYLVAVSDLTNPDATDPFGVPWINYVRREYSDVQRAAVKAGILKPGSELQPHYAIDILRSDKPDDANYTVMALAVPSEIRGDGIKVVGMIRPDVTQFGRVLYLDDLAKMSQDEIRDLNSARIHEFEDATGKGNGLAYLEGDNVKPHNPQMHGRLWFGPIILPGYQHATLRNSSDSLRDLLEKYALQRIEFVMLRNGAMDTQENYLVFGDDIPSVPTDSRVYLDHLKVPDLKAKGAAKDVAANEVALTVGFSSFHYRDHVPASPLRLAAEHAIDYLLNGYDAPIQGNLVRQAVTALQSSTLNRIVHCK